MASDATVALSQLAFRWHPRQPLVLDIDELNVGRGERLFIKGASGSGKSSLLGLLAGVVVPSRGEVRILGEHLQRLGGAARDRFRADHMGVIFQMFNLLPYLSVLENVMLPCRFSARRREKALQQAPSVKAEALRLLQQLDLAESDILARPVTELSVGQQQRVAAARALIGAPELLIADEPTSALDWDRRESFLRLLLRECAEQQSTLVFVSHDPSLESLFDRALSLHEINRAGSAVAV